jgi:23S rRNA-/tRNA-specific pseudouridylate synthase
MAAHPEQIRGVASTAGKEAKTEFLVEQRFVNFTLLRVKIHTGRMHQIRAHMLAYNHPVVGDPLYFQKKRKRRWDDELGRLFLQAVKLGFTDLAGEQQTFELPLDTELSHFLQKLS